MAIQKAKATLHFIDGTKMNISYPQLSGKNSMALAESVRKAIEADKLAIEVRGKLLIIPSRNIKYIEISPVPDSLPHNVIRDAEVA